MAEKEKDVERIRKTMAQQLADFEIVKKALTRDLQNRCEKVTELEISLDETRNNVLRNSNNKAQQKKMAFLERNLEHSTNLQKQLVEQNSSLKKEVAIAERELLSRNDRIQALEALLLDAQEELTSQNIKFKAQLLMRERLEKLGISKAPVPLETQQQLQELFQLLFFSQPQPYDFKQLKQEIGRLKHQEIAYQVRKERTELEQLTTEAKAKVNNLETIVDSLLETQKQIVQISETSQKDRLNGKIEAYRDILSSNLTQEELQTLLTKQTELVQLEKHLTSLQQNQQQAQILQPEQ